MHNIIIIIIMIAFDIAIGFYIISYADLRLFCAYTDHKVEGRTREFIYCIVSNIVLSL